jgi:hypothetical protein
MVEKSTRSCAGLLLIAVTAAVFGIVASRAGKSMSEQRNPHYGPIEPFLSPVAQSVKDRGKWPGAPYPASEIIRDVEWASVNTIIRKAEGSDNWPITWADDDNQYAAYGDGWGFEPTSGKKLSLGLARISGGPEGFQGVNIVSKSIERVGDDKAGPKASGMLCVNGIFYMLVRNVGNSQLAWSDDHGVNWNWCDWKFETSFGAPTFLNFGRNYAGARDNYIHIYSHDSDSAYAPADRMVLARIRPDQIRERKAYEFLRAFDESGRPIWTRDIHERCAVFVNPGRCYRSGITYNPGLKRYLWCQILPFSTDERGPRFQGGFGIYEAPEPWGPGPGETSTFPTKWMSADGRTLHLLFSGNDSFSIRKAILR